jgi:hypothetical protein
VKGKKDRERERGERREEREREGGERGYEMFVDIEYDIE